MKETFTIRKSDVERLGKVLIKEIDYFLHDEYIINTFPEMKLDQKKFILYYLKAIVFTFPKSTSRLSSSLLRAILLTSFEYISCFSLLIIFIFLISFLPVN